LFLKDYEKGRKEEKEKEKLVILQEGEMTGVESSHYSWLHLVLCLFCSANTLKIFKECCL
jgi:hypothetical protein